MSLLSKKHGTLILILFCISAAESRCPGTCNRKTAKKVYVMGEIGVGKSTLANVLTGQLPSTGCFEAKASMNAVTRNTYDHGCFPLVDGSTGTDVIIVDTPGLNDLGMNDIHNLKTVEKYHNNNIQLRDTDPSAFLFLLKDGRFEGALSTMLDHLVQSFGPTFWQYVVFGFVRMPFTSENVYTEWPTTDLLARLDGKTPVYGHNLIAHRKRWAARFHKEAVKLLKQHFTIDGNVEGIDDLPNFEKRIFYIDAGHLIKKEKYDLQVKTCQQEASNPRLCDGLAQFGYPNYINQNPQVVTQFKSSIQDFSALLNKLSQNPFKRKMKNRDEVLHEIKKLKCQAEEPFKHWNSRSFTCDWNICTCGVNGKVVHPHSCPKHGLNEACAACNADYELIGKSWSVRDKNGTSIDIEVGSCKYKQCYCNNGVGRKGKACTKHNEHQCESCNSAHYLESSRNRCEYKKCKCHNGYPTEGAACSGHGRWECQRRCFDGYKPRGGRCKKCKWYETCKYYNHWDK